jgi:DNA-binding GntR family transcriptional regulator
MESSRHARLQQMLARAVDRPLIHRSLTGCDLAHLRTSARFHELIADAVRQGDAERAERLTIEHVLQARDALVALIADQSDETAV